MPKRLEDMTPEERLREASKYCPKCGLPPDLCTCSDKDRDKDAKNHDEKKNHDERKTTITIDPQLWQRGPKCGGCGYPFNEKTKDSWTFQEDLLRCPKCGKLHKLEVA